MTEALFNDGRSASALLVRFRSLAAIISVQNAALPASRLQANFWIGSRGRLAASSIVKNTTVLLTKDRSAGGTVRPGGETCRIGTSEQRPTVSCARAASRLSGGSQAPVEP